MSELMTPEQWAEKAINEINHEYGSPGVYTEKAEPIVAKYIREALAAQPDPRVTALVEPSDVPYPPFECLRILSDFADMMLTERDYDGHNWEQIMEASNAAKGHFAALTAAKCEQQL